MNRLARNLFAKSFVFVVTLGVALKFAGPAAFILAAYVAHTSVR